MSRRAFWAVVVLVLLIAAALRFYGLGEVPGGLSHDEVANWLIVRGILNGQHAIYFTAGYGHEPLYHYLQAGAVALLGDNWLGLRYASGALGMLGVAVVFVVTRRLFRRSAALPAASWAAVSFWPVFYSRVALRAILLPSVAGLSLYFLLRALEGTGGVEAQGEGAPREGVGLAYWLLCGLFLGLSLYTYMAARVLPALVAVLLLYLLVGRAGDVARHWGGFALMLAVAASLTTPLALWLAEQPGAEYRVAEVSGPLNLLLDGDPSLVVQNLLASLGAFTFAGDRWPQQNLPGRPVFTDVFSGVLFYAGLLIALRRWRDYHFAFPLIWLAGALVPSVVTSVAPSSIRTILGVVVVFAFPALALASAGHWLARRSSCQRGRVAVGTTFRVAFCAVVLAPTLLGTVYDYFVQWPEDEAVQFFYQTDLTAVGEQLNELPPGLPVAVAGLSVHSMDLPSLQLASRVDLEDVRLCDTRETLVLPGGEDAWLFVPDVVPFDVDLHERLTGWGVIGEMVEKDCFVAYRLSLRGFSVMGLTGLGFSVWLDEGTAANTPVSFGGTLALLGYEWLASDATSDSTLSLLTYWRVEEPGRKRLKISVHLLDDSESLVAQHDGLGSPAHGWASGDIIVQKHIIVLPANLKAGSYAVRLGVYEAESGDRLSAPAGDAVLLSPVEVRR